MAEPPSMFYKLHDDPQNYVNDANVEVAWAIKAAESASIHLNLLMAVDTKNLKLNKYQDEVYTAFRRHFPNLDVERVDQSGLKGDNKDLWRIFCEEFKETVSDYNFGTILRIDAGGIYDEANTIIVPKVIYLAIEGARNVEGVNEKFKPRYTELHKNEKAKNPDIL